MRITQIIIRGLAWIVIAMLIIPPGIPAQDSGESEQADRFTKEELTQMLASIALYPDSLIAHILMASTYPIEIVEAERWLRQNAKLKGDALDNALQEKTWDPSIKSLCHFPDILFAMSDKLDQTRKLGDAFLGQEEEVMATIQELRYKANKQGNLKTSGEQQVIVEPEDIRIEPVDPQVVYVPVYDPLYVYGPWWYPDYPPYYWYYPPGIAISAGYISFGPSFFIGFDLFSWAWFDWHTHHIHRDIDKTRRFHRFDRHERDFDQPFWRHNPGHRRGVAYRDRRTIERFGTRPSRVSPVSPETRGYPPRSFEKKEVGPSQAPVERRERAVAPQVKPSQAPVERRERAVAPQVKPSQAPVERRERTVAPQVKPERERIQPSPRQDTPFRGIEDGSFERKAGKRGGESRRSIEVRPPSGGIQRQGGDIRQQGGGFRR